MKGVRTLDLIAKLDDMEEKYEELGLLLSQPEVINDQDRFRRLAREHARLKDIVAEFREFRQLKEKELEARELIDSGDQELEDLARMELEEVEPQLEVLEERLPLMLLPRNPRDDKNVIMEIRSGAGGDEAAIFAGDLYRMFSRYAEEQGWSTELLNANPSSMGGYKEIVFSIEGQGVYRHLKYESGVHRVQRIPTTESGGRIHTSTVTVAVLPEAEEVELEIDKKDLRIETYRSSGPGGQSVNTTDSAVRITHLPTEITVSCQDEKSQHKNRSKALRVLRARLLEKMEQEQQAELDEARKMQVGTGDRSERIRTYNFPQGRVTDHRINFTTHQLDAVLDGKMEELIDKLITSDQMERLKQVN